MDKPLLYPWKKEEIEEKLISTFTNTNTGISKDNKMANCMVGIVSRMAEKTTERTNRVPEKAMLNYFSFAGKNRRLPNPAVVPVKFYQTATKETTTVPAQAQVSTLTSDHKKPILFETTEPLTVVKPDLQKFVVADFDRNRYEDKSNLIETILERPEKLYNTDTPFTYDLHLHHPMLDELGEGEEYWLQVVLEFNDNSPESRDETKTKNVKIVKNAQMVDRADDIDFNLFSISLNYQCGKDTSVTIPLKVNSDNIREISSTDKNKVYTIPVKFDTKPLSKKITGLNSLGKEVTLENRFITLSFEVKNREFFDLFHPPILEDVQLRLFYKPEIRDGFLQYEANKENTFTPEYRDITNVEHAFYNDKKLDTSKPFKPFGDNPELGDTFAFSSKFFSMKGQPCEINLWMMGDLLDSKCPFYDEHNPDHAVYNDDVLLGWEYFDGKEWKIFATTENNVSSRTYNDDVNDPGLIKKSSIITKSSDGYKILKEVTDGKIDKIIPYDPDGVQCDIEKISFFDGSNGLTGSAHFDLYSESNKNFFPSIKFLIPKDIQKIELHKTNDWWIRVRILRGGTFKREIEFGEYGRIEKTAISSPPFLRSFTINYTGARSYVGLPQYTGAPAAPCTSIVTQNAMQLTEQRKPKSLKVVDGIIKYPLLDCNIIEQFSDSGTSQSERMLFLGLKGEAKPTDQYNLFFSITPDLSMVIPNEHLEMSAKGASLTTLNSDGSNRLSPAIQWQYWDGKNWRSLEVTDRTNGLTTAQNLQFYLPQSAQKRTLFDEKLFWIRGVVNKKEKELAVLDKNGNTLETWLYISEPSKEIKYKPLFDRDGKRIELLQDNNGRYFLEWEKEYYRNDGGIDRVYPFYINEGQVYPDKAELAFLNPDKDSIPTINTQLNIQGINQNMVLAESFETVRNEILGNSLGNPELTLSFVSKPVAANPIIVVRENNIVNDNEHTLIRRDLSGKAYFSYVVTPEERLDLIEDGLYEDSVHILTSGEEQEIWVEWEEVDDFSHSGPRDRHYVVDHVNGRIHFGDNINGRIPDAGSRNIKALQYRFGGGAGANIDIGEIRNLVSTIPYISGVKNLTIAKGGDDLENNTEIFHRATRDVAAFGRAVVSEDYEALALAASGGIHRVKAYSGLRPDGTYQTGWVTMVLIADQLGARPVPSAEFMTHIEESLANRCNTPNVNELSRFNPLHSTPSDNEIQLNNISVVPPNYITTWVEASLSFDNEQHERSLTPVIGKNLSTFLHAITGGPNGTGWDFGRDAYISEISRIISEMEGVKEVKELRLKANQMRFILKLQDTITVEPDLIRGNKAIPAGAQVTSHFAKALKNENSEGVDTSEEFEFKFLTAKPIEDGTKDVVVEGFKEGDIITLKTMNNIGYENCGYTKREKVLGRARVTGVETHFFGGFVKNDRGETIRGISHFRIYLRPMSLKLPGHGELYKHVEPREFIIKNSLSNDAIITAEAQHGSYALTGEPRKIATYVKQLVASDGTIYRRMGGEILNSARYDEINRNDDMRHVDDMAVKSLPQMGDEEIIAIDVAIPNLWGTADDDQLNAHLESSTIDIYPLGKQDIVQSTTKGELKKQQNLLLDPENIFFYVDLENDADSIDNDRFILIPEYTEQVFLGPTDLPTAGHHRIVTDILLSEGEDPIAHTSVQNTTLIPGSESHIWYKTRTSMKEQDMIVNETLIQDISNGANIKLKELEGKPQTADVLEQVALYTYFSKLTKDNAKQSPDISNTTDAKSISGGAQIPDDDDDQ